MENRLRKEKTATFLVELAKELPGVRERHDRALEINRFHEFVERLTQRSFLTLEFAVPYVGDTVHFYVTVGERSKKIAVRAMYETWEGVRLSEVGGATGPTFHGKHVVAGYVSLKDEKVFARSAFGGGRDLCEAMFSGLAHVRRFGEEALVQILIRREARSGNALETNMRIVASSESKLRAEDVFDEIAKGFLGNVGERGGIRLARARSTKEFIRNVLERKFDFAEKVELDILALVCIAHPPHALSERANIRLARSREFPLPARAQTVGTFLGDAACRGEKVPVRITETGNIFISGDSSSDNARIFRNLVCADVQKGKRVVVLDLERNVAPAIVASLPKSKKRGLWYVEADSPRPVGLNVLEVGCEQEIAKIIEYFLPLEIQGPLVERYLRNVIKLLAEDSDKSPATLLDIPRALVDRKYRAHRLRKSRDVGLIRFWEEAQGEEGEKVLGKLVPYVLSAWREVVLKEPIRLATGQARPRMDIGDMLRGRDSVLVVNLKSADIGEPSISLLAMLWLLKIKHGAAERPFSLYVYGAGGNVLDFLASFFSPFAPHVRMVVSSNLRAPLSPRAVKFISNSAATHVVLRLHKTAVEQTALLFGSHLKKEDILHLEPMHAYIRLGGEEHFFKMKLDAAKAEHTEDAHEVIERSRNSLGKDLLAVEREVASRLHW